MRESAIYRQHPSDMTQGQGLWPGRQDLTSYCPHDTMEKLLFFFGPQFLHVSSRKQGRRWPRKSLGPFFLCSRPRRGEAIDSRWCCSLAASSPVLWKGQTVYGSDPAQTE